MEFSWLLKQQQQLSLPLGKFQMIQSWLFLFFSLKNYTWTAGRFLFYLNLIIHRIGGHTYEMQTRIFLVFQFMQMAWCDEWIYMCSLKPKIKPWLQILISVLCHFPWHCFFCFKEKVSLLVIEREERERATPRERCIIKLVVSTSNPRSSVIKEIKTCTRWSVARLFSHTNHFSPFFFLY